MWHFHLFFIPDEELFYSDDDCDGRLWWLPRCFHHWTDELLRSKLLSQDNNRNKLLTIILKIYYDQECQGSWYGGKLGSFHLREVALSEPIWPESFMWLEVGIPSHNPSSCSHSKLSGMDKNYDFLEEILLWDPLSETWQVVSLFNLKGGYRNFFLFFHRSRWT